MNFDLVAFNFINQFAGKWQWLDYFAMFFAQYFEYFLLIFLVLLLAINLKKYWRTVFVSLVSAVVSRFIVGTIIRYLWFRPRPFVALNFIPLISQSPAEGAFPSGHALFYFALSTAIYLYNKKLGVIFYIASFLIVVSRVFTGVHWLSDILAGAIIGTLIGWLTNKIFNRYL